MMVMTKWGNAAIIEPSVKSIPKTSLKYLDCLMSIRFIVQERAKFATIMAQTGMDVNTLSHGVVKTVGCLSDLPAEAAMLCSM